MSWNQPPNGQPGMMQRPPMPGGPVSAPPMPGGHISAPPMPGQQPPRYPTFSHSVSGPMLRPPLPGQHPPALQPSDGKSIGPPPSNIAGGMKPPQNQNTFPPTSIGRFSSHPGTAPPLPSVSTQSRGDYSAQGPPISNGAPSGFPPMTRPPQSNAPISG